MLICKNKRSAAADARRLAAVLFLSTAGLTAVAQKVAMSAPLVTPKVEIFAGYSYFYPNATLTGTLPGGIVPVSSCLCDIRKGAGVSVGYNFNRWVGLTADASGHWGSSATSPIARSSFFNVSFGPRVNYRSRHFVPFAEFLVGVNRLSPQLFTPDNEIGYVTGLGVDVPIGRHIAFRPVQADYVISNHHFGTVASNAPTDIRGLRLQAGVVFAFGGGPRAMAPAAVMPAPMAAMPAPVAAPVIAVAAAPTIVCAAMPMMMNVGESSTITSVGTGQGPLVYTFQTDNGTIVGSNETAILSTAGARPGTVLVTCNVADNMGRTAFATTTVTLAALPKTSVVTSPLCSISFARDMRRPTRVNNEAKACLDDVAMALQRSAGATLVLVGSADPVEHHGDKMAAERAVNTKAYLVQDKGIEPARIQVYSGPAGERAVAITLVPVGATNDSSGNVAVDESVVNPQPR
jgi:hypothetical protein